MDEKYGDYCNFFIDIPLEESCHTDLVEEKVCSDISLNEDRNFQLKDNQSLVFTPNKHT